MKNHKLVFLSIVLASIFALPALAQRNYVVEYDKIADTFTYSELVYRKGKQVPVPIRKPKVEHGDVITFRVINLNEFVFGFQCSERLLERKKLSANPILSGFLGFAPLLSNIGGGLSQASSVLESVNNSRGVADVPEPGMEEQYRQLELVETEIAEAVSMAQEALSAAALLNSTELTLEEIRTAYKNVGRSSDPVQLKTLCEKIEADYTSIDPAEMTSPGTGKRWKQLEKQYRGYTRLIEQQGPLLEADLTEWLSRQDFVKEQVKQVDIYSGSSFTPNYGSIEYFLKFFTHDSEGHDSLPHVGEEEASGKLVLSRRVELSFKGSFSPSWAAGVYFTAPFAGRNTYTVEEAGFEDSLRINTATGAVIQPSIGTHILFEFKDGRRFIPHVSLGAALGFGADDDKFLNFMLGGGIRPARIKYLSLNGGFSLCQVKETVAGLPTNTWVPFPADPTYFRNRYKPGAYVGIHFHF